MSNEYPFIEIESKWQRYWHINKIFSAHDFKDKQKNNVLLSSDTLLNSIKYWWDKTDKDEEGNHLESYMIFLGESKHKIKKKAEQEACRIAIDILVN